MKKTLLTVAITTTALFSNASLANNDMYIGASYDMMTIDVAGTDADSEVITLKAGKYITDNIGFEVVYGTGISDSSADVGVKNYYGAYLVGINPITDKIGLTAKIGWAKTTLESSIAQYKEKSDDAYSLGVGAEYQVAKQVSLSIDFTKLHKSDITNIDDIKGFTLGAKYTF